VKGRCAKRQIHRGGSVTNTRTITQSTARALYLVRNSMDCCWTDAREAQDWARVKKQSASRMRRTLVGNWLARVCRNQNVNPRPKSKVPLTVSSPAAPPASGTSVAENEPTMRDAVALVMVTVPVPP